MARTASKVSPDERRWRAESDYRTLSDADEIQRDAPRHRAAKSQARKQLTRARRIAGGRR